MALHILVGLKRLDDAKQRLMPDLSPPNRRELMLTMLRTVVAAARESGLGPVALATSEPTAPALARELGVTTVSDGGLAWNEGLVHGLSLLRPQPAAVLYLAADLPLLTSAELHQFASAAPDPGVCIARATDGGTNALLVTPANGTVPHFGARRSSEVHAEAARAAGLAWRVIDIPGLALDVDTIADAWATGVVPRPGG